MIEILYAIFIAPIELLMSFIFNNTELLTTSKSFAIVLLSLSVSILLVPIYNLFDYWQEKDRVVERLMQPKLEMIKRSFIGQERFAMLKTAYAQFGYHPIYGVRNSLGFLLQIPFFIAAYQYLSYAPELQNISSGIFKNLSEPDQLISIGQIKINALPILMTLINLWSGFIYSKHLLRKDKIQVVGIALVFLVLLYNSASGLVLYWTFNNIFSLIKNVIHNYRPATKKVENFMERQNVLPYLAGTLFLTIAFFYFPSKLVASDPSVFNVQNRQILVFGNYYSFLVLGLISIFVVKYFFAWMTKLIDAVLFVLVMFAVLTATYNIFDTGAIDHFKIADISEGLGSLIFRLLIDIILIMGLSGVFFLLNSRVKNQILLILLAVFLILSLIITLGISNNGIKQEKLVDIDQGNVLIPKYIKDAAILSTNKPNIIVIMLDGFTNPLFETVLELDPELRNSFQGFTWYSNTLATGSNTYLGGPSIHGGIVVSPYEINKRSAEIDSIASEINRGYLPLLNALSNRKYKIDLLNMQYTSCNEVKRLQNNVGVCTEYSQSEGDLDEYYLDQYIDKFSEDIENLLKTSKTNTNLPSIGLYYSVFYSLRGFIYNKGQWLSFFNHKISTIPRYSYYAFLTSFIDLLSFNKTETPVYKYINSGFTHAPWNMIDSSCSISLQGSYYDDEQFRGIDQGQLFTTYCAIKEIQKLVFRLQENNTWDNTILILVSDHGYKGDLKLASVFTEEGEEISFNNYPGRPSSLLLVKDINSKAPLKESKELMTPADVPSIVCHELGGCSGIAPDPRLGMNADRKLIHTYGDWHPDRHPANSYDLKEVWEVTGNMYQRENWRRIDDSEK